MALKIEEQNAEGVTVLRLTGRVTLGAESNQLRSKLKELLDQGRMRVVLDLGEVTYLDSAGLGTLVAGYTSARSKGASVKLANLTKKITEQLNITKLVTVFEVHGDVAAAVKSFVQPSA
jgi:anti-sigma B factor antagonist